MNKPAPVPLFNYKKRQRQALVSDPDLSSLCENKPNFQSDNKPTRSTSNFTSHQSFVTSTSTSNAPMQGKFSTDMNKPSSGLMDMSGSFSNYGNQISNSASVVKIRTNSVGQNSFQGSSNNGRNHAASFVKTRPSGTRGRGLGSNTSPLSNQRAGQNRISHGRGLQKISNFFSPIQQGSQDTLSSCDFNVNSISNGRHNAFQSPASGSTRLTTSVQGLSKDTSASKVPNKSSTMLAKTAGSSAMQNICKGSFNNHRNNTSGFSGAPGQFTSKEKLNPFNTSLNNDLRFEEDDIFSTRQKMLMQNESKPKDTIKPVADTSMRIFTCPIATLKSWVELKAYNGPVMFEVYGILDSATVKNPMGTGKEFVIRDDTDSIKCVFYEIDRELPRLTRGQVHRVVGTADKRRGLLQVVCMRPALKEERRVCQAAGALSQAEMELVATGTNEQ